MKIKKNGIKVNLKMINLVMPWFWRGQTDQTVIPTCFQRRSQAKSTVMRFLYAVPRREELKMNTHPYRRDSFSSELLLDI